jgi:hypothetical protein
MTHKNDKLLKCSFVYFASLSNGRVPRQALISSNTRKQEKKAPARKQRDLFI